MREAAAGKSMEPSEPSAVQNQSPTYRLLASRRFTPKVDAHLDTMQVCKERSAHYGSLALAGHAFANRIRSLLNQSDREHSMTKIQTVFVTGGVLALSGLIAACQMSTSRDPAETKVISTGVSADAVREMAPEEIAIVDLTQVDGNIRIKGRATTNGAIAEYMRTIDQSGLGNVFLDHVQIEESGASFMMQVSAK
jgi:hypothetical protein